MGIEFEDDDEGSSEKAREENAMFKCDRVIQRTKERYERRQIIFAPPPEISTNYAAAECGSCLAGELSQPAHSDGRCPVKNYESQLNFEPQLDRPSKKKDSDGLRARRALIQSPSVRFWQLDMLKCVKLNPLVQAAGLTCSMSGTTIIVKQGLKKVVTKIDLTALLNFLRQRKFLRKKIGESKP
uniref:Uncharacterized protein n=1 Tax=Vitrella brassicaformis TaxID=1169539 RepID=A0A7S1KJK2_9ALVE|mmetsp:Transcript_801/g.1752  ORF Transcript_801/g.1752 Transcript_801/m.1752 type:complete len:184 (+) Transcript_801:869-1420(+)